MLQSTSSGIQVKQTVFHLSFRHAQKRIESFWDSRHALVYEFPCQVQDKNSFIGFNEVRRPTGVVSFTWRLWKGFFQQKFFTTIRPQQSLKLKCNVKKHASDLFVCVLRATCAGHWGPIKDWAPNVVGTGWLETGSAIVKGAPQKLTRLISPVRRFLHKLALSLKCERVNPEPCNVASLVALYQFWKINL